MLENTKFLELENHLTNERRTSLPGPSSPGSVDFCKGWAPHHPPLSLPPSCHVLPLHCPSFAEIQL